MKINPEYQPDFKQVFNREMFTVKSDWLCLSHYGNFPHSKFLQDFSYDSAIKIVENFKSREQIIPIYIGHPDDNQFCHLPEHQDQTPYAIIDELEARNSGLYFKASWNPQNIDFIKGLSLRFLSPRWICNHKASNEETHVYEPAELVSIGLTNDPNLPLDPIADDYFLKLINNANDEKLHQNIFDSLLSAAQLPSTCAPAVIVDFYIGLINQVETFKETNNRMLQQMIVLENEVDRNRKLFLSTQEKLITTEALLKKEKEVHFDIKPPTASKTGRLIPKNHCENIKDQFVDSVNEHMKQTGKSFVQSWIDIKQKYPHLFSALNQDNTQ